MSPAHVLAFHLDSSLPEFGADGILLLFLVLNALMGWRYGLMRRVIGFGGCYLGVLAATYTGNGLSSVITGHDLYTNAWVYIGVFLTVILMMEALGALYNDRIQKLVVITFDRASGLASGIFIGFCEAAMIFLIAIATAAAPGAATTASAHGINVNAVNNGTLSEYVVKAEPMIKGLFGPALPSNLPDHLAQNASPTPTPAP